jgi:heme exporter protein D
MNDFIRWLAMGGYSSYVWSAYGIVICGLFAMGFGCLWQQRRIKKQLHVWFKHNDSIRSTQAREVSPDGSTELLFSRADS